VPVVANLRHHDIEPVFNEDTLADGGPDFQWKAELTLLWELATVLEAGRGKPAANQNLVDFNFSVDWNDHRRRPRPHRDRPPPRGSPLDKLVAELMIAANSTWGKLLADAGIPALYRAQTGGKVRMTTPQRPTKALASIATPGPARRCAATWIWSTSGSSSAGCRAARRPSRPSRPS
jgi:exoribonuclease-2